MIFDVMRRKALIRRRKGKRETRLEEAERFNHLLEERVKKKGIAIAQKLQRELQQELRKQDGCQRLYKLDLRRGDLSDAHVEALAEALEELPVVRKLDLRGNPITAKALSALNHALGKQLERFQSTYVKSSDAEHRFEACRLSFLHSVKLDPAMLAVHDEAAVEMKQRAAALEIADCVLDVRHAFLQADIKGTGTLTGHELSGAMHDVIGVNPTRSETEAVLRLHGECADRGKNPALINLSAFEASMVNRLRQARVLPCLSRDHEDLLFGPARYEVGSEPCSPWRTSSSRQGDDEVDDNAQTSRSMSRSLRGPGLSAGLRRGFGEVIDGGARSESCEEEKRSHEIGRAKSDGECEKGRAGTRDSRLGERQGSFSARGASRTGNASGETVKGLHQRPLGEASPSTTEGRQPSTSFFFRAFRSSGRDKPTWGSRGQQRGFGHEAGPLSGGVAEAGENPATTPTDDVYDDPPPVRWADYPRLRGSSRGEKISWMGGSGELSHPGRDRQHSCGKNSFDCTGENRTSPNETDENDERWISSASTKVDEGPHGSTQPAPGRGTGPGCPENGDNAATSGTFDEASKTHSGSIRETLESSASESAACEGRVTDARSETEAALESPVLEHPAPRVVQDSPGHGLNGRSSEPLESDPPNTGDGSDLRSDSSECKQPLSGQIPDGEMDNEAVEQPRPYGYLPGRSDSCQRGISRLDRDKSGSWGHLVEPPSEEHPDKSVSEAQSHQVFSPCTMETARDDGRSSPTSGDAPHPTRQQSLEHFESSPGDTKEMRAASPMTGSTSNAAGASHVTGSVTEKDSSGNVTPTAASSSQKDGPIGGNQVGSHCDRPCAATVRAKCTAGTPDVRHISERLDSEAPSLGKNEEEQHGGTLNRPIASPPRYADTKPISGEKASVEVAASELGVGARSGFCCNILPHVSGCVMREPWYLNPEKIAARAQERPLTSCAKREMLAAHIRFTSGAWQCPRCYDANSGVARQCASGDIREHREQRGGEGDSRPSLPYSSSRSACRGRLTSVAGASGLVSPCYRGISRRDNGGSCPSWSDSFWEHTSTRGRPSSPEDGGDEGVATAGYLRPEEETSLTVQVEEGALILSRNGLNNMGIALELEAKYGYGRDTLLALHTLVLSCNQLKVLEKSVLTAMPALRHLDVSHNLLCRMEPVDGRDLSPHLETLNMSHNRITRIGGIGQCFSLRVLDLSHNRIKTSLGLEHLSLLEQLDLGHNLISKAVSARALSFNRSLKLLWLEGNPFALDPRYRPTLTCLLPHVRAIDLRGMPPSGDRYTRGSTGGHRREIAGSTGSRTGVSRAWRVDHDGSRSREWDEMMTWGEEKAQCELDAGVREVGNQESSHTTAATQVRQLADELENLRPGATGSNAVVSGLKKVARSSSVAALGVKHRPGDDCQVEAAAFSAASRHQGSQEAPSIDSWPRQPGEDEDTGRQDVDMNAQRIVSPGQGETDSNSKPVEDGDGSCNDSAGEVFSVVDGMLLSNGRSRAFVTRTMAASDLNMTDLDDAEETKTTSSPQDPWCRSTQSRAQEEYNGSVRQRRVVLGSGLAWDSAQSPPHGGDVQNGACDSTFGSNNRASFTNEWVENIAQEAETASTALQVLLEMYEERDEVRDNTRRLARFRLALEGMGLFTEPRVEPLGDLQEGTTHANRTKATLRRITTTKSALGNMLRLMEETKAGGSPELDRYARFVRQELGLIPAAGNGRSKTPEGRSVASMANVANVANMASVASERARQGGANIPEVKHGERCDRSVRIARRDDIGGVRLGRAKGDEGLHEESQGTVHAQSHGRNARGCENHGESARSIDGNTIKVDDGGVREASFADGETGSSTSARLVLRRKDISADNRCTELQEGEGLQVRRSGPVGVSADAVSGNQRDFLRHESASVSAMKGSDEKGLNPREVTQQKTTVVTGRKRVRRDQGGGELRGQEDPETREQSAHSRQADEGNEEERSLAMGCGRSEGASVLDMDTAEKQVLAVAAKMVENDLGPRRVDGDRGGNNVGEAIALGGVPRGSETLGREPHSFIPSPGQTRTVSRAHPCISGSGQDLALVTTSDTVRARFGGLRVSLAVTPKGKASMFRPGTPRRKLVLDGANTKTTAPREPSKRLGASTSLGDSGVHGDDAHEQDQREVGATKDEIEIEVVVSGPISNGMTTAVEQDRPRTATDDVLEKALPVAILPPHDPLSSRTEATRRVLIPLDNKVAAIPSRNLKGDRSTAGQSEQRRTEWYHGEKSSETTKCDKIKLDVGLDQISDIPCPGERVISRASTAFPAVAIAPYPGGKGAPRSQPCEDIIEDTILVAKEDNTTLSVKSVSMSHRRTSPLAWDGADDERQHTAAGGTGDLRKKALPDCTEQVGVELSPNPTVNLTKNAEHSSHGSDNPQATGGSFPTRDEGIRSGPGGGPDPISDTFNPKAGLLPSASSIGSEHPEGGNDSSDPSPNSTHLIPNGDRTARAKSTEQQNIPAASTSDVFRPEAFRDDIRDQSLVVKRPGFPVKSTEELQTPGATPSVVHAQDHHERGTEIEAGTDGSGGGSGRNEGVRLEEPKPAWLEAYDPGRDCYVYHHVTTGESTWNKPDAPYEPFVKNGEDEAGFESRSAKKAIGARRQGNDERRKSSSPSRSRAQVPENHPSKYNHKRRHHHPLVPAARDVKSEHEGAPGSGDACEEEKSCSFSSKSGRNGGPCTKAGSSSLLRLPDHSSALVVHEEEVRGDEGDYFTIVRRSRRGKGKSESRDASSASVTPPRDRPDGRRRRKTALERLSHLTDEESIRTSSESSHGRESRRDHRHRDKRKRRSRRRETVQLRGECNVDRGTKDHHALVQHENLERGGRSRMKGGDRRPRRPCSLPSSRRLKSSRSGENL